MTPFAARSLWPGLDRRPLVRLAVALVAAPALVAALIGLGAFMGAGLIDPRADPAALAGRSALVAAALGIGFTMTLGAAGIAVLWAFAMRNAVAWALTGGVAGGIAGGLYGLAAMSAFSRPLALGFALAGWSIFLLVRHFAGVTDGPARA